LAKFPKTRGKNRKFPASNGENVANLQENILEKIQKSKKRGLGISQKRTSYGMRSCGSVFTERDYPPIWTAA
ncbi:MAG TPA: hypothetical protein DDZ51_29180, partial [Planctomycetaceae bacterium]|nr:hypothetical protein [Planctomycetaceae bacterium]